MLTSTSTPIPRDPTLCLRHPGYPHVPQTHPTKLCPMNSRHLYTFFTSFRVLVDTSNYIIQARAGIHTTRVFVLATNWPSLHIRSLFLCAMKYNKPDWKVGESSEELLGKAQWRANQVSTERHQTNTSTCPESLTEERLIMETREGDDGSSWSTTRDSGINGPSL